MADSRKVMDEWNAQLERDGRVELRRRGWRLWTSTLLPLAVAAYLIASMLRPHDRPAWASLVIAVFIIGDIIIFVGPVVRLWTAPQPGLVVDADGLHVARPQAAFAWTEIIGRDTPETRPRTPSALVLAPAAADRWRAARPWSPFRKRARPGSTIQWYVPGIYGVSSQALATWLTDEVRPRFTSVEQPR